MVGKLVKKRAQEKTLKSALVTPLATPPAEVVGSDARCKIRDVATKLFAKCGLEGTSTRDIAKQSGLNLSLISYYFGGKQGLYKNLFIEFANEAHKTIGKITDGFDPKTLTQEQFCANMLVIIQSAVEMQVANPEMMTLMQREKIEGLPYAREVWEEVFHSLGEKIVAFLQAAQDRKIIRGDLNLQYHFLAMIHSVDILFIAVRCRGPWEQMLFKLPEDKEKVARQVYNVFVEGILI
jgi:AcrR family transcriptional regulator